MAGLCCVRLSRCLLVLLRDDLSIDFLVHGCFLPLKAAQTWMTKTKEAGMADVVSYNTVIKVWMESG